MFVRCAFFTSVGSSFCHAISALESDGVTQAICQMVNMTIAARARRHFERMCIIPNNIDWNVLVRESVLSRYDCEEICRVMIGKMMTVLLERAKVGLIVFDFGFILLYISKDI